MILVGSQRGGAKSLAVHLLNSRDNDHVRVHKLRGFMATNLADALEEAHAVSKGTRAKQFLFSLSLNPPKEAKVTVAQLEAAADRAEIALCLQGQARAIVIHEKNGRRHAHVVWSRIDADSMTAINMPFFKTRLNQLSKELFLEHEWELPDGFKQNGWKNPLNFTLAEWQQAESLDIDPRELKQMFVSAWTRSDDLKSLRAALEEQGLFLARGDRRGFVAVDVNGNVFSLARWSGVKTKELRERFGAPDGLPSVEDINARIKAKLYDNLRTETEKERLKQRSELEVFGPARTRMVRAQRRERRALDQAQRERAQRELRERAQRFRRGWRGLIDILSGRARALRRQNALDAAASLKRDEAEREALAAAHLKARSSLQDQIDAVKTRHRAERVAFAHRVALLLRSEIGAKRQSPQRAPDTGLSL